MIRLTILTLIMCSFTKLNFAQSNKYFHKDSPYRLSIKKDLPLALGSAGLFSIGINTLKKEEKPEFTIGQFSQNDIQEINFIDRSSAGNWNPTAKNFGKPFVYTSSIGVPIGLLAFPGNLKARASLMFMFYEGYYLTGGLVTLSKGLTNRYRPYTYLTESQFQSLEEGFLNEFLEDIEGSDIEDSFFSGDAAKTAYGFMFFAKAFNDYFPSSKFRKAVWISSFAAIGIQGYFRVKSGKHFPTDVIVGSVVGGGLGYLIPHLHKTNSRVTLGGSSNGLSITYSLK